MDNVTFDLMWNSLSNSMEATQKLEDKLAILQTKLLELHTGRHLLPPPEPEAGTARENKQLLREYRDAICAARSALDEMEKEVEDELGPGDSDEQ